MRLIRERSPLPRLLFFPVAVLAAFGFFWLRTRPDLVLALAGCPLKDRTGIPCPTCGGTRAAASLAAADLAGAWTANPLVVVLAVGFLIWAVGAVPATILPGLRFSLILSSGEKRAAGFLAALAVLATWIWQLVNQP